MGNCHAFSYAKLPEGMICCDPIILTSASAGGQQELGAMKVSTYLASLGASLFGGESPITGFGYALFLPMHSNWDAHPVMPQGSPRYQGRPATTRVHRPIENWSFAEGIGIVATSVAGQLSGDHRTTIHSIVPDVMV